MVCAIPRCYREASDVLRVCPAHMALIHDAAVRVPGSCQPGCEHETMIPSHLRLDGELMSDPKVNIVKMGIGSLEPK